MTQICEQQSQDETKELHPSHYNAKNIVIPLSLYSSIHTVTFLLRKKKRCIYLGIKNFMPHLQNNLLVDGDSRREDRYILSYMEERCTGNFYITHVCVCSYIPSCHMYQSQQ